MASAARGLSLPPPALYPSTSRARPLFLPAFALPSPAPPRALSLGAAAPTPRFPTKAAASSGSVETEAEPQEEEAPLPAPVEAQVASAEKPKGEQIFGVVMIGSRQYFVIPGRFLTVQRLKGANVNDKIVLNKVLLVGTKENLYIGQPIVQNAVVHAVVEEQGLDPKVIVFKYKKKKHYKRTVGHRQPNTRIRIIGITGYQDAPCEPMPAP